MKKRLVLIVGCAVVLAAAIVLLTLPGQTKGVLSKRSIREPALPPDKGWSKHSVIPHLRANQIAVMNFQQNEFQPVVDWTIDYFRSLSGTAVFKKLDLVEEFKNSFNEGARSSAEKKGNDDAITFDKLSGYILTFWESIVEITFVVSEEMFDIDNEVRLPKVLIVGGFRDGKGIEKIRSVIDDDLLKGGSEFRDDKTAFRRSEENPNRYELTFHNAEDSFQAYLELEPTQVRLAIGTNSPKSFLAESTDDRLVGSSSWAPLNTLRPQDAAILYFLDWGKLTSRMDAMFEFMEKLASDDQEALASLQNANTSFDLWKGMETLYGTSHFRGGIVQNQCVDYSPGSTVAKLYNPLRENNSAFGKNNTFHRLITDKTILGLQFSGGQLQVFGSTFALTAKTAAKQAEKDGKVKLADIKKFWDLLLDLSSLPIHDFGFLLNAGAMGPIPEGALLLTSSEDIDTLQNRLRDGLNRVGSALKLDELATTESFPDGESMLRINISKSVSVVGRKIGEKSLLFVLNPSAFDRFNELASRGTWFTEQLQADVLSDLSVSSSLFYMSSGPLVEMGQGFIPMVQSELQEKDLQQGDIHELADLLKGRMISYQRVDEVTDARLCIAGITRLIRPAAKNN